MEHERPSAPHQWQKYGDPRLERLAKLGEFVLRELAAFDADSSYDMCEHIASEAVSLRLASWLEGDYTPWIVLRPSAEGSC